MKCPSDAAWPDNPISVRSRYRYRRSSSDQGSSPGASDDFRCFSWDFESCLVVHLVHPTDRLGGLIRPSYFSEHCPHWIPMKITNVITYVRSVGWTTKWFYHWSGSTLRPQGGPLGPWVKLWFWGAFFCPCPYLICMYICICVYLYIYNYAHDRILKIWTCKQ